MSNPYQRNRRVFRIGAGLLATIAVVAVGCQPPPRAASQKWKNDATLKQIEAELQAAGPRVVANDAALWKPIEGSRVVDDMVNTAEVEALENIIRRNDLVFTRGAAFYALQKREPERTVERAITWMYLTRQPVSVLSRPAQQTLIDAKPTSKTLNQCAKALEVAGVSEGNIAIVVALLPDAVVDAWFHTNDHDPENRFVQFAASEVFTNRTENKQPQSDKMKGFLIRCRDEGGPTATLYFLHYDGEEDARFRAHLVSYVENKNVSKDDFISVLHARRVVLRKLYLENKLRQPLERKIMLEL
jgi:hypothetical protein